ADTWAAVAIFVRNLVLNWLVIIPVVCIALLLLKLIATGSVLIAHSGNDSLVFGAGFHHHAPSGTAVRARRHLS
ncbi:MAG: hypothetical protein WBF47_03775, partial [Xanthobacteraceae bacterium]